jgi:hypothetical protein
MSIIVTWLNQTKCCVETSEEDALNVVKNLLEHGTQGNDIVCYNVLGMSGVKISFDWISTENER